MEMEINSISDFRKAIRNGPYAWPGGYPVYFILSDGEALSFKAAKEVKRELLEALRDKATNNYPAEDWLPVALEINFEDTELYCSHTNELIECAYGD
jgi:hypothetical protein